MRVARLFLFVDWPEKYFSGQSEGGISNASGTRSVRVSAQGLSRSCCKLSPMKIPLSRLAAPRSPRMITSLTPALYHTLDLGTPSPNQTCVLTSKKADDLVHASPALTSTDVTSKDVQQPTLGKTMQNSPATERTDLSRLQAPTIPLEDTPKYLSHRSPPTPIDIAKLASYLQGHPDPLAV